MAAAPHLADADPLCYATAAPCLLHSSDEVMGGSGNQWHQQGQAACLVEGDHPAIGEDGQYRSSVGGILFVPLFRFCPSRGACFAAATGTRSNAPRTRGVAGSAV